MENLIVMHELEGLSEKELWLISLLLQNGYVQ